MANLYAGGVDKFSYEGRIAFTENHLDDIFDSADRPLERRRWWLVAEDPFQCLATCINLAKALRSSSPKTIISCMPVHQLGAAAINLVAGEKPADVYLGIAASLEMDQGSYLMVDRKLVKQTVMKSLYGMTCIGARDQIKKRLKDRCAIEDEDELFAASCYATKEQLRGSGDDIAAADYTDALKPSVIALPLHGCDHSSGDEVLPVVCFVGRGIAQANKWSLERR
ncbi:hypothetical protein HYC85_023227 [Camellia sinensis]|uniref:DNA-directed RNA polymerase n=1 Tax=Camellia sinensis TaxID=4442 RepID=A0A7J7GHS3_CAMSI|nr:hypothetical protein HYC85_023227 [Camellia sinensis]